MNAPLPPAWLRAGAPPGTEGVAESGAPTGPAPQRMVWHSRYGSIEIEVVGQAIYVNGEPVQPAPGKA